MGLAGDPGALLDPPRPPEVRGTGDMVWEVRGEVVVYRCSGCMCWGAGKGEREGLKLKDEEKGECSDWRKPCATGDCLKGAAPLPSTCVSHNES